MPIYVPGRRDRHNRGVGSAKRNVVAVLSLTAMVDMFTVLAVFLLQNYNVTGQVIEINQEVELPDAATVKELKPSSVVTISDKKIMLDSEEIIDYRTVKEQQDWMVNPLAAKIEALIKKGEEEKQSLRNRLRTAVTEAKEGEGATDDVDAFRKITIQSDKSIDFLTVKKVMFTVTEAGIYEINFAVIKRPDEPSPN